MTRRISACYKLPGQWRDGRVGEIAEVGVQDRGGGSGQDTEGGVSATWPGGNMLGTRRGSSPLVKGKPYQPSSEVIGNGEQIQSRQ